MKLYNYFIDSANGRVKPLEEDWGDKELYLYGINESGSFKGAPYNDLINSFTEYSLYGDLDDVMLLEIANILEERLEKGLNIKKIILKGEEFEVIIIEEGIVVTIEEYKTLIKLFRYYGEKGCKLVTNEQK